MAAAVVMLGVVVGLMSALVIGLLRSNADVLRALHDLGVGEEQLAGRAAVSPKRRLPTADGVRSPFDGGAEGVADITGSTPTGDAVHIGIEAGDDATLLAFLSSGCSTCEDFWRAFGTEELHMVPGRRTRVVIVTRGPEDESPPAVGELAPNGLTTVMSSVAWEDYGVPVSPYFILVDGRRGVLGEGAATNWGRVVELLERSLSDLGVDLDGQSEPSRRELLGGMRLEEHGTRALIAAGIDPEDPPVG